MADQQGTTVPIPGGMTARFESALSDKPKVSRAILEDRYQVLMHSRGRTIINPSRLQKALDDVVNQLIDGVSQNQRADPEADIMERVETVLRTTVIGEIENRGVAL